MFEEAYWPGLSSNVVEGLDLSAGEVGKALDCLAQKSTLEELVICTEVLFHPIVERAFDSHKAPRVVAAAVRSSRRMGPLFP